jgi:EmrB/QacA subfamily drug resistance transporter
VNLPDELGSRAQSASTGGLRGRLIARLEARGTHPTWVLWAALSGMFATTFPITILTISLGSIADEFGTRETTIAWVITAPMLCSAVALPLMGKLGDLYGHRRIFLLGFGAATLTAAATAAAWDALSLIGLRTVAAVVGGATQPTAMALIFSVYDQEHRVRAMGWWSMTTAAAPALGLIAGGPLVDWLGWRVVFVLQAGFSLLALGLAGLVLRETQRQRVRFDFAGAGTLAVGVAGLMYAVGRVRDLGFASPWIGGAAAISAAGLFAFVRVERVTASPLLPLDFFRRRNFTAPMISNAMMGAAYMGAFVLAPLVLLGIFRFSISTAAAIMLLRTLTLTLSSPLGGQLGSRFGERRAALLGSAVITVSLLVIATGVAELSLTAVAVGLVLQGLGHGLGLPSLNSAVASSVPDRDLGIASAVNRLVAQVGTAFGIATLTTVYGGSNTGGAFGLAFLVGAGFSVLSVFAAGFMASPARRPERSDPGEQTPRSAAGRR